MKPIKRPLSLRKETVRHLTADQLRNLAGGNADGTRATVVYQCGGTLISCAACTELQCILNTSVITSCR
jgi:hypothetical protein